MAAKKTKVAKNVNKTRETKGSVEAFLAAIGDAQQRADARLLCDLMRRATGEAPKLWGTSIIGFGSYHYRYESGREGDAPLVGLSPRKAALTLYLKLGSSKHETLMAKLGKFKTGGGCLYLKKLNDVDAKTLETLVRLSADSARQQHAG